MHTRPTLEDAIASFEEEVEDFLSLAELDAWLTRHPEYIRDLALLALCLHADALVPSEPPGPLPELSPKLKATLDAHLAKFTWPPEK